MKILITGSTGFIGQNLVNNLLTRKYEIHAIIRNISDVTKIDKRVKVYVYNENINNLYNYFNTEKFNGVIHLASLYLPSHTKKDIYDLISSNVKFGTELLEMCKEFNVQWFINTGTFWQHYNNEDYNPVNLYAATKQAFESIAKYFTETSDLIFTTIKLNDTFGPNDSRNKIFNLWNKISKTGEVLEMSPGEQLIDISYIEDVVNAYAIIIDNLNSGNVNEYKNKSFSVKSNERMSLKKLSEVFEEATNTKLNIKWSERPYREREVLIPWESGELVPGWEQKYTLKEAIKKTFGIISDDK